MRAEPRGSVDLGEAIGREQDVDRLWSSLISSDVVLTGRWGIGKSTLIRLAQADGPTGWAGRHIELEALTGVKAAVAALLESVWSDGGLVAPGPRTRAAIEPLLDGEQVSVDKLDDDWHGSLRAAITAELEERDTGLVLAFDDFDRFVARTADAGEADELGRLVELLAELTDQQDQLRLLFVSTTDLGRTLERVRPALPEQPFASCEHLSLEALSPEAGARLVMALLLGESITARDRAALARSLADDCDHVPRWIHCAMAYFAERGRPILEGDLERCMIGAVEDLEAEPWELRRELAPVLDDYWQPQRGLAFSVLDQLALADEQALSFRELRRGLAVEMTIDEDAIRRVIEELRSDQLVHEVGGTLRFSGELLRNAWLKLRWLS